MTEREISLRWAAQFEGADALRQAVRDRLLGADVGGLAFGKTDEHPEDVIVALLQFLPADDSRLDAIVTGWRKARRCVGSLLEGLPCESIPVDLLDDAFARVFRVAERTGHSQLRDGVFSDLQLAISSSGTSGIHVQQVVAAASAYKPRESDRALWEPALEIEDVGAYAFQAILRIASARTQITTFLERLIRHQYEDDWDISVWFIADFATTAFGSDHKIVAALRRIRKDDPSLWGKIKREAHEDVCWSDKWVSEVEGESALEMRNRRSIPERQRLEQSQPTFWAHPSWALPTAQRSILVGNVCGSSSVSGPYFSLLLRRVRRQSGFDETQMTKQLMQLLEPDWLEWLRGASSDEYDITEVKKHA